MTWFGQPRIGLSLKDGSTHSFPLLFLHGIYFSAVSFATLGYGDVVGVDIVTKLLSSFEAILGIYTMAVVVYALTKRYIKE
jgi:hypothetical protein